MLKALFERAAPRDHAAADRIKGWVREIVESGSEASDSVGVTVSEIICTDPGCPGTETVILIMRPGHATVAAKLAKAIVDVTETDAKGAAVVAVR
jgi:hypothetical protein